MKLESNVVLELLIDLGVENKLVPLQQISILSSRLTQEPGAVSKSKTCSQPLRMGIPKGEQREKLHTTASISGVGLS